MEDKNNKVLKSLNNKKKERFSLLEMEGEKEEIQENTYLNIESLSDIVKKINIDKDLQINDQKLDEEFMSHSDKFKNWQIYYGYCSDEVSNKENQLDLLEATLDKKIREENREKKPTENSIKNEIILNEDYQKLKSDLNKARFNLNIAKGALNAFDHKKKALERLTDFWIFGYNSEPKQKPSIKEKILDSTQNKIKGGLNK